MALRFELTTLVQKICCKRCALEPQANHTSHIEQLIYVEKNEVPFFYRVELAITRFVLANELAAAAPPETLDESKNDLAISLRLENNFFFFFIIDQLISIIISSPINAV